MSDLGVRPTADSRPIDL